MLALLRTSTALGLSNFGTHRHYVPSCSFVENGNKKYARGGLRLRRRRGQLMTPVSSSRRHDIRMSSAFNSTGDPHPSGGEWIGPTGAAGSLERLCGVSLRACQLMDPLVSSIYARLESPRDADVKKSKRDDSAFTIADGLVQRLLVDVLFARVGFRNIVGEEDDDGAGGDRGEGDSGEWFRVQDLTVPDELRPLVTSTKAKMETLAAKHLPPTALDSDDHCKRCGYEHVTVFVDPIDGTREFSSGKGEQCSICIGFADERGKSIGGVVYRPLSKPKPTWVAGAKAEGYAECDFGDVGPSADKRMAVGGLLTTNGSISPFVQFLIEELQYERLKAGGAGNKMMLLLENSISGGGNALYIQDRGVSRWDTCAAEACLEAFGGALMKLTPFVESCNEDDASGRDRDSYTYLASRTNLDFIPGSSNLTKYNCRLPSGWPSEELRWNQKVFDVKLVKPYSNLCGLVALGKEWNTEEGRIHLKDAVREAAAKAPPSFD